MTPMEGFFFQAKIPSFHLDFQSTPPRLPQECYKFPSFMHESVNYILEYRSSKLTGRFKKLPVAICGQELHQIVGSILMVAWMHEGGDGISPCDVVYLTETSWVRH